MKHTPLWILMVGLMIAMTGCATRDPTVAHVHIGHAMTGWHDTPQKAGLFVVAEQAAAEALQHAQAAVNGSGDVDRLRTEIRRVRQLSDATDAAKGTPDGYGVKQALSGADSHITYAATSPDASANVKAFAGVFSKNAAGVTGRCDVITALGGDIAASGSAAEALLLAQEVEKLAYANVHGEDLDGDGRIGSQPAEYGLAQLRREIENMIAREDPPYRTVPRWYLFNLIRLPDGSWIFRKREAPKPPGGGYY